MNVCSTFQKRKKNWNFAVIWHLAGYLREKQNLSKQSAVDSRKKSSIEAVDLKSGAKQRDWKKKHRILKKKQLNVRILREKNRKLK